MRVLLTDTAEHDLEDIGDFIALDSPRRAFTFVQELRRATETIGEYPEAFPLIPRYEHYGIRRRPYRNYLVFYLILADHVEVTHVLNSAQDYETILFPDD